MPAIDREGTFRAQIREYGLFEAESGAVAVNLVCDVLEHWNGESWEDWREYALEAEGAMWIVKKDNAGPNEKTIASLCRYAGWDGDVRSISGESWQPQLCQIVIRADSYNNQTRYRVAFINGYDSTPGGTLSNVDADKALSLHDRYGSQLRAIAGNAKLNSPGGSKEKPPSPKPREKPAKIEMVGEIPQGCDIPF